MKTKNHLKDEEYYVQLAINFENTNVAIYCCSKNGTIKTWNKASENLLGFTSIEMVGKDMALITPSKFIKKEKKIFDKIYHNEIVVNHESTRWCKSGRALPVSISSSPLQNKVGHIVGVCSILRDFTLQKKLERTLNAANKAITFQNLEREKRAAELLLANVELDYQNKEKQHRAEELLIANKELAHQSQEKENRAAELVIANEELAYQNAEKHKRAKELLVANQELLYQNKEKANRAAELLIANVELAHHLENAKKLTSSNEELERFAYVAAHDLQEPLRMITNFLTQLERKYGDVIDERGKRYIYFAVDGARRMRHIILDLLEYSKIGRSDGIPHLIDVNDLLRDILVLLAKKIKDKKAIITIDNMPVIKAEISPIRQVFQNLIYNALEYSSTVKPVQIKVLVKELEEFWEFAIADNGIGINKEDFEKIFQIFQRLHSKEDHPGTGIGLAISKKIIETYGGKIWVASEEGKGSTFYLTIKK